jgi:uncharacterized membrane protein
VIWLPASFKRSHWGRVLCQPVELVLSRSRWGRVLLLPAETVASYVLWLLCGLAALALIGLSFWVAAGFSERQGTIADAAELTLILGAVLAILATGHWRSRRTLARQEQRRLRRWPFVPWLAMTLLPLAAGVATKWARGEDFGTRLRRECASVVREGTGQTRSLEMQELLIRQCIDRRGLNAR